MTARRGGVRCGVLAATAVVAVGGCSGPDGAGTAKKSVVAQTSGEAAECAEAVNEILIMNWDIAARQGDVAAFEAANSAFYVKYQNLPELRIQLKHDQNGFYEIVDMEIAGKDTSNAPAQTLEKYRPLVRRDCEAAYPQ